MTRAVSHQRKTNTAALNRQRDVAIAAKEADLGVLPDSALAKRLGIPAAAVTAARVAVGLPLAKHNRVRRCPVCRETIKGRDNLHVLRCRQATERAALPRGVWRAPDDGNDAVIDAIDSVLVERGWEWADLAARSTITKQVISYWLLSDGGMRVLSLLQIADALGVPPSKLLAKMDLP